MSIQSVMPSSHLILCRPLLLLPPIPPSIRVFSNESALHIRCPKYWSFSFSISSSNEHPGLISFRMDWLDLPAVQGTLKSLLQHHGSKASCGGSGLIAKLYPTLATPQTGPPASSVHGILQARILELVRGICPTRGSNPWLLCCRQILYG